MIAAIYCHTSHPGDLITEILKIISIDRSVVKGKDGVVLHLSCLIFSYDNFRDEIHLLYSVFNRYGAISFCLIQYVKPFISHSLHEIFFKIYFLYRL